MIRKSKWVLPLLGLAATIALSGCEALFNPAKTYHAPQFTTDLAASANAVAGTGLTLTVATSDSDAGDTVTYVWEETAVNASAFSPVTGQTGLSFVFNESTVGTYKVEVIAKDSHGLSTTSTVCTITVQSGKVAVTGVTLSASTMDLYGQNTGALTATVTPSTATDTSVTWSSSDSNVATVSGGVVAPVGPGTATITATTTDGNYTASCAVTVSYYVAGAVYQDINYRTPAFWANNVYNPLPLSGYADGVAYAVALSGSSQYFVGSVAADSNYKTPRTPVMWTNGVLSTLTLPSDAASGDVANVTMTANGPLTVGYANSTSTGSPYPLTWLSQAPAKLAMPAAALDGYAYGVLVSGGSTYVSGEVDCDTSTAQSATMAIWYSFLNVMKNLTPGTYTNQPDSTGKIAVSGTFDASTLTNVTFVYNGYVDATTGYTIDSGTVSFSGAYTGDFTSFNSSALTVSGYGIGVSSNGSSLITAATVNSTCAVSGSYWQSSTGSAVINGVTYPMPSILSGDFGMPIVWTDEVPSTLPLPDGMLGGWPLSLAMSGADLIVGGVVADNANWYPVCWVNGTCAQLKDPSGAIVAGDVNSVFVVGNDVYLVGDIEDSSANLVPAYWLNGSCHTLTLPNGVSAGTVMSITTTGSTIYFAGHIGKAPSEIPAVWTVDGKCAVLSGPTSYGDAYSAKGLKRTR